MSTRILLLSFTLLCLQCTNEQAYDYQNGLYIEHFEPGDLKPNCYSDDNVIYTFGKKFLFEYDFFDKNGTEKKIFGYGKELFDLDADCPKCIEYVSIEPLDENKSNIMMFKNSEGYSQTVFEQDYIFYNKKSHLSPEKTGIIENNKNVWLHPWRKSGTFSFLQLNPYPFIMTPFEIGNKWNWDLRIGGSQYLSLIDRTEAIISKQSYEIVDQKKVETKVGLLNCWIIDGVARNGVKDTKLRSFFNEEYGFVRFEYDNIDGSRMDIYLSEVRNL